MMISMREAIERVTRVTEEMMRAEATMFVVTMTMMMMMMMMMMMKQHLFFFFFFFLLAHSLKRRQRLKSVGHVNLRDVLAEERTR